MGQAPGCLIVYRDGVSDSELERVRVDEVGAIIRVRPVDCNPIIGVHCTPYESAAW